MNAAQRAANALVQSAVLLEAEADQEEMRDAVVSYKLRSNAAGLRASAEAILRKAGEQGMTQKEYAGTPGIPAQWQPSWPLPEREFWECDALSADRGMDGRRPSNEHYGTIVSSRVVGKEGNHAPCLDLDFPARLIPSSTPGHSHLYLDVEMPWPAYRRLLSTLRDVGLLQSAFASRSIERQQTMLIREGLSKKDLMERGVKLLAASDVEIDEKGDRMFDSEHNRELDRKSAAKAEEARRAMREPTDINF